MVIEGIDVGRVTEQLKAVGGVVPIDRWSQVEAPLFVFCLDGGVGFHCVLILVVPFGTIEGVRAESAGAEAGMPADVELLGIVTALIESFSTAVVGIQTAGFVAAVAVAACEVGGQAVAGFPLKCHPCSGVEIAV